MTMMIMMMMMMMMMLGPCGVCSIDKAVDFNQGDVIMKEGDEGDAFYLVEEGEVNKSIM